jgi:adenosylcobinamide-phosphate synthase
MPNQPLPSLVMGLLAWSLLLLPLLAAYFYLHTAIAYGWVLDLLLLYLALGGHSLMQHVAPIQQALAANEAEAARGHLSRIVSRETAGLDQQQVRNAAVESLFENSNDAIYGALFWFALAGGGGVMLYRLCNTLDAMWGYRNPQYEYFGKFAARMDDLLNLVPAWLTSFWFSLQGRAWRNLATVWRQGLHWKSPNAGLVMASGAASIGVKLGGEASYHGVLQQRPVIGLGSATDGSSIPMAMRRVRVTTFIWLIFLSGVLYGLT